MYFNQAQPRTCQQAQCQTGAASSDSKNSVDWQVKKMQHRLGNYFVPSANGVNVAENCQTAQPTVMDSILFRIDEETGLHGIQTYSLVNIPVCPCR